MTLYIQFNNNILFCRLHTSEAAQVPVSDTRAPPEGLGPPGGVERVITQNLERRVHNLEQQMTSLRQVVMQKGSHAGPASQGHSVWSALTFAGWLMVPLVVVFMYHYRKTAH